MSRGTDDSCDSPRAQAMSSHMTGLVTDQLWPLTTFLDWPLYFSVLSEIYFSSHPYFTARQLVSVDNDWLPSSSYWQSIVYMARTTDMLRSNGGRPHQLRMSCMLWVYCSMHTYRLAVSSWRWYRHLRDWKSALVSRSVPNADPIVGAIPPIQNFNRR